MDALTRILDLADVQGVLDVRCLLAGPFSVGHDAAAADEAPFHLVLRGSASMELPGRVQVPMAAGDLIVLPRGTPHRLHDGSPRSDARPAHVDPQAVLDVKRNTLGPADIDLLCGRFTFSPDAAALIFGGLPEVLHVRLADAHGSATIEAVVGLFRDEVDRLEPGALAVVTSLSRTLLVFALRAHLRQGALPPSLLALLAEPRLGRAVLAMLRDPAREWTVEALAREAAMSRATFARHFETRGSMAPHEVLTLLRMHLAGELLRRGHLTAGAVADQVGYRSESAFGKAFARVMGVTPARFRRDRMAI